MDNALNVFWLVKALGGRKFIAERFGVSASAIQKMEAANAIPAKHWPKIVKETKFGISYNDLAEHHFSPRS